jgi:hypothetical protein
MLAEPNMAAQPATTTQDTQANANQPAFQREKHIQYFKRNLQMLPEPYTSQDTFR